MIKAGVTGGIGSGKTTVCHVFRQLGVPVFQADVVAKELYDTNESVRNKMTGLLGESIYDGGNLDKRKLSRLIFSDRELLHQVNRIVHPEVASYFLEWCQNHTHDRYVIQESAILLESNANKNMDVIITVTAPVDLRMKRVMKRQGMTKQLVVCIMENQMPDEMKIKQSHYIIENDDQHLIIPQVMKIHEALAKANYQKII